MSTTFRTVWGFTLLALGIAGLILPVMPGWIFLIPGLVILAERFHWARRLLDWAKQKLHGRNPHRE